MKKKLITTLFAVLAFSLLFTGCAALFGGSLGLDGTWIARTEATSSIPATNKLKIVITDDTAVFYEPSAAYLTAVAQYIALTGLHQEAEWPASDWETSGNVYTVAISGNNITFSKAGVSIPATLSEDKKAISFTWLGTLLSCKKR